MTREQKFYVCRICGNIIGFINNSGVPIVCCGEEMQEIIPNTVEAAVEKHMPEVTIDGNKVNVKIGSVPHPMTEEHYIQWVYIETKKGGQRKILLPGEEPKVSFELVDDELLSVFAYCNLHGLWKLKI